MIYRHSLTWVAIIGLIVLMFLRLPPMVAKRDSLMNVYGPLVEVDALCRQQYVEPIRDTRLVEGAIRGMMLRLDPYSGYIAPSELSAFERRTEGDYSGVGLEVGYRQGRLTVIAPVENSPAAHAGVRPGDAIISVNGTDVDGRSVFDVEEMLVGTPGSRVLLRVLHPGDHDPIDLEMLRGPVHVSSVRGFARRGRSDWDYWIDAERRIGYIRVSNFLANTMSEFDGALRTLRAGGLQGLIIDLRFNPGGIMQQAIAMVDRFVSDGPILATVTRRRAVDEFRAKSAGTITDIPLVVLINGGSASAAEIVSGSLQAHHRATIVGTRSFGKGSVQHVVHLTDQSAAVKLTTAYYRLPDGRIIHRTSRNANSNAWGIIPDVVIELDDAQEQAIRDDRKRLDLAFIDTDHSDSRRSEGNRGIVNPKQDRALTIDFQLRAAIENVLGTCSAFDPPPS